MQLRKKHRKAIRNITPCLFCGKDHLTKECSLRTVKGKRKFKDKFKDEKSFNNR
jgi:hypothetical protein